MGVARYDPDRRGYRIFVGNLAGVTTHDDLANLFCPYGPIVDVWLASNPPGFGFVVFKSAADAEKAVTEKNSSVYLGRVIKVQHARMFRDRISKSGGGVHDDSATNSSRSRSQSRSRSRSHSRSSSSWSSSSSRLSFFSKIYGSRRKRLRSSSRSRSRSSGRSSVSVRTPSPSRPSDHPSSTSPSRSRSREKSRRSRRRHSNHRSHHHHGRRHRRRPTGQRKPKQRRRRHNSRLWSQTDSSSTAHDDQSSATHSLSPPSRSEKFSAAPRTTSAGRYRQRVACRHCRHCKKHTSPETSEITSDDSPCRISSSSKEEDKGASVKNSTYDRSRKRSRQYKMQSPSSSTSSSSRSSVSPMSPRERREQEVERKTSFSNKPGEHTEADSETRGPRAGSQRPQFPPLTRARAGSDAELLPHYFQQQQDAVEQLRSTNNTADFKLSPLGLKKNSSLKTDTPACAASAATKTVATRSQHAESSSGPVSCYAAAKREPYHHKTTAVNKDIVISASNKVVEQSMHVNSTSCYSASATGSYSLPCSGDLNLAETNLSTVRGRVISASGRSIKKSIVVGSVAFRDTNSTTVVDYSALDTAFQTTASACFGASGDKNIRSIRDNPVTETRKIETHEQKCSIPSQTYDLKRPFQPCKGRAQIRFSLSRKDSSFPVSEIPQYHGKQDPNKKT